MVEKRQGGLGQSGLDRARRNLAAQDSPAYDKAILGAEPDAERSYSPPTPWRFPASSRIDAYQYDPNNQRLHIVFTNHGRPTGYIYEEVPTAVFQAFDSAPSQGQYVNSTLNYMPYHRASAGEELGIFGPVFKGGSEE